MKSPQGFVLYKIFYGENLVYLGRTKQPLDRRLHGHYFNKPMHRKIDISQSIKIEYAIFQTEADMNLYEVYFINALKPPLNCDDRAQDNLTVTLPAITWTPYIPPLMQNWIERQREIVEMERAKAQEKQQKRSEYREAHKRLQGDDWDKWLEENGY